MKHSPSPSRPVGQRLAEWARCHQRLLAVAVPSATFVVGLLLPSPFQRYISKMVLPKPVPVSELVDTVGLRLPDGSVYDGQVVRGTSTRQGFGRLQRKNGTVYEGQWADDRLSYGQRTTPWSVYTGHFDKQLRNHGYGIVRYSPKYLADKRRQGRADGTIVAAYYGNWSHDVKQGIGRSVMADSTMEFGRYADGVWQKPEGMAYKVGERVYGIDVSHHQPDINWDQLALYCDAQGRVHRTKSKEHTYLQPVLFAYIKATEGTTVKDATYSVRATEAERHGLCKGAYHFFHLGSDVDAQVHNFLETVSWTPGDLPPALDIEVEDEIKEYGDKQLCETAKYWLQEVEKRLRVRPIIYTREKIRNRLLQDKKLRDYDYWIARYNDRGPDCTDWRLWQFTEKAALNGYNGSIDVNLFRGDYRRFRRFVHPIYSY